MPGEGLEGGAGCGDHPDSRGEGPNCRYRRRMGEGAVDPDPCIQKFGDSGKGHAIKLGITLASHPAMLQFDADLQFVPEDIPRVIRPVLEGEADLAIGSRFMDGADKSGYRSNFFRDKGNTFLNRFISCLTGQAVTDVTTGLKAWNRKAIWDIDFKDNRFIYEMEIVVRGGIEGVSYRSGSGYVFQSPGRSFRSWYRIEGIL